ncbi:MAG TPA: alpha-hydroxy acid oxidase [Kofleriaceae bacterium]|nr:alpha-hydroxy acid oxidase [Kofleriaceae bacterium]
MTAPTAAAAPLATLAEAQARARRALPEPAYDYGAAGASDDSGRETGVLRNVARLDDRVLVPRVLAGAPSVDLSASVTGGGLTAPILVAPMGLQALFHREAELSTAAAAARLGLGFVQSMFSSRSIEEVAAVARDGLRWQQIYLLRDPGLTASVVARAEAAGAAALVVTADVPLVGSRSRTARHRFDRFAAVAPAIVEDPAFRELLARRRASDPGCPSERLIDAVFPNPAASWDDLARLCEGTRLPVLLKGVLDPRDARRAVECGAAGVVVSTHGGRQSTLHPAAVDALAPVLAEVGSAVPVYFDSGVRSGQHVAVALALGARAVLVGRPVLWGLAAGGQLGVEQVLSLLVDEVRRGMVLAGAPTVAALRGLVVLDERRSQLAEARP